VDRRILEHAEYYSLKRFLPRSAKSAAPAFGVCPSNFVEDVSASKFPLLDRRGGCAIKKKAAFLAGADGVVD
jgi:hypothetical protein